VPVERVVDEMRQVSRGAGRTSLICDDCYLVSNPLTNWQPMKLTT